MAEIDAHALQLRIGVRIAELRRQAGMTQAVLATEARTTTQYIARVEAGGANLTIFSLAKLANALGVAIEQLFVESQQPRRSMRGRPPKKSD